MKIKHLALGAALAASSSFSSAIPISVSDIDITNHGGGGLTWNTYEFADFSFDLDGTATHAYGRFRTTDFPIRACEGFFCSGSDLDSDRIYASMFLTPPGSEASSRGRVSAVGQFGFLSDRMFINFDNDWIDMGSYEVSFRDLTIRRDGTYNLLADFREVVQVSEPGTLALLGLGLIGLGVSRRKLKS